MTGKLPPSFLEKYVWRRHGRDDPRVLVGPGIGEDAAVIDMGDRVLVLHSDPITEAVEGIGWLALNIAANDVATAGARPLWASVTILLPEGFGEELLDEITRDLHRAAEELGVSIVGGHTEEAPRLDRPILVVTMLGEAPRDRYVRTGGAGPGDAVLVIKSAGLEGTSILAKDFRSLLESRGLSDGLLERAAGFAAEVSVVREALLLAELGATSLHDPTEGGLIGGLVEVALASGKTLEVWEESVPVRPETRSICEALGLDPLKLISSGALIATVPPEKLASVEEALRRLDVEYGVVGRVHEGAARLVIHRVDGRKEEYMEPPVDELARVWEKYGSGG